MMNKTQEYKNEHLSRISLSGYAEGKPPLGFGNSDYSLALNLTTINTLMKEREREEYKK